MKKKTAHVSGSKRLGGHRSWTFKISGRSRGGVHSPGVSDLRSLLGGWKKELPGGVRRKRLKRGPELKERVSRQGDPSVASNPPGGISKKWGETLRDKGKCGLYKLCRGHHEERGTKGESLSPKALVHWGVELFRWVGRGMSRKHGNTSLPIQR